MREEDFITTEDAAEMIKLTPHTLRMWRSQGKGPKWIQLGRGVIRYRVADILAWLKNKTVDPNV